VRWQIMDWEMKSVHWKKSKKQSGWNRRIRRINRLITVCVKAERHTGIPVTVIRSMHPAWENIVQVFVHCSFVVRFADFVNNRERIYDNG